MNFVCLSCYCEYSYGFLKKEIPSTAHQSIVTTIQDPPANPKYPSGSITTRTLVLTTRKCVKPTLPSSKSNRAHNTNLPKPKHSHRSFLNNQNPNPPISSTLLRNTGPMPHNTLTNSHCSSESNASKQQETTLDGSYADTTRKLGITKPRHHYRSSPGTSNIIKPRPVKARQQKRSSSPLHNQVSPPIHASSESQNTTTSSSYTH